MSRPKILIQLDCDPQPSVFDAVVAVDSGVDHLFRHSGVTSETAPPLVHGAIFTRGPEDLSQTAIFVGGSDVAAAEAILQAVTESFFGPLRVSVLMDANGCNTTASAAVLAAARELGLANQPALVLGGTGPVGQRVSQLLASEGAHVRLASRRLDRAEQACQAIQEKTSGATLSPVTTGTPEETDAALEGVTVLVSAGAGGVTMLSEEQLANCRGLKVAIDLNALPPVGLTGIDPQDQGTVRHGIACYGAIGVGGTKMTIHREAIARLFTSNDLVLDAQEVFALGASLKS